ncbi:MAG TPA: polyribonucleotide nucleotidyltransferase, partial [Chloroflexota bacterium]|nr:polyribonucleotide nucleotidyltransferase [Chloroflexota bacterium]
MSFRDEVEVGGKTLVVESGLLAGLADGAVTVRYGDTLLLATAVASQAPREGVDFFPLTIDFEEKLYAAGKIPGGFIKREGRPSEHAILSSRLTDRPLRPLFPKGFRNDVQVIINVLSADQENDPDVLGICGASCALSISDIPFNGPVAAVRVGYVNDSFVINPTESELKYSDLDLVVAGTRDAVMMVEAGAQELPEDVMLEAIRRGHEALQPIIDLQERMVAAIGRPKRTFPVFVLPQEIKDEVAAQVRDSLREALYQERKEEREKAVEGVRLELLGYFAPRIAAGDLTEKQINEAFQSELKYLTRRRILEEGIRPDLRDTTTIRPISCAVGLLPRPHGSGLFTRGQTQVLTICTLGPTTDEQMIDDITSESKKRFMHQYNFPPFSTGEARPLRSPGRREIGHGALAERSVAAVVPGEDEFPYVIRLVSEVLSSNGSTSMASVCASTLALMDAGVPISAPVAGVAMGLITGEEGRYAVLTDIQGIEDALGDMDFKVAGTADGVTGLQMDIKVKGITFEIMEKALQQAHEGRLFILDRMLEVMPEPRASLSPYAPRIIKVHINPDKIGALIGPGGKMIRKIQEECQVSIEVQDDGTVLIATNNEQNADQAVAQVKAITQDVEVGQIYDGVVKRLIAIGAFVEILPGKEGLVHISQLSSDRVGQVEDVVKVGDPLRVKVVEIDGQGRINLSHRATLPGFEDMPIPSRGERRPPSNGFG